MRSPSPRRRRRSPSPRRMPMGFKRGMLPKRFPKYHMGGRGMPARRRSPLRRSPLRGHSPSPPFSRRQYSPPRRRSPLRRSRSPQRSPPRSGNRHPRSISQDKSSSSSGRRSLSPQDKYHMKRERSRSWDGHGGGGGGGRSGVRGGGRGGYGMGKGRGFGADGGQRKWRAANPDPEPQKDIDYRKKEQTVPASNQTLPRRFDSTGTSLHLRFTEPGKSEKFIPDHNITISIERNIAGDKLAKIPNLLAEDDVIIIRRKDEGKVSLCKRQEFITREDTEVEERRVIKVQEKKGGSKKEKARSAASTLDSSTGHDQVIKLSDRWGGSTEVNPKQRLESLRKDRISNEELDQYLLASDPQHGDTDDRISPGDRGLREDLVTAAVIGHGDQDERFVMKRQSDRRSLSRSGYADDQDLRGSNRPPGDLRNVLKRKSDKEDAFDARQKILKKREEELKRREEDLKRRSDALARGSKEDDLPDFSNRPDKYKEDWSDKPESIPKGKGYYEHDNREDFYDDRRGRGRGFRFNNSNNRGYRGSNYRGNNYQSNYRGTNFRGSNYRGSNYRSNYDRGSRGFGYRGRGSGTYSNNYSGWHRHTDSPEREWKHDKFQNAEETENKPSSTTSA